MTTATIAPTVTHTCYTRVDAARVPAGLRFDVPRQNQGQIVTVSYAASKTRRGEHGHGDEWKHTFDASDRSSYYSQWTVELDMGRVLGGYREFRVFAGTGVIQAWDNAGERWVAHSPSPRARTLIRAAAGL
ncbi:MAG: hypothetical protein EBX36_08530 [Planctomycetia bacterium]|nr:hypothetical protein [Planctomycetia bacterium]